MVACKDLYISYQRDIFDTKRTERIAMSNNRGFFQIVEHFRITKNNIMEKY